MTLDDNKVKITVYKDHILIHITKEFSKEALIASMEAESLLLTITEPGMILGVIVKKFTHVDCAPTSDIFLSNTDEWDYILDKITFRNEKLKALGI